MPSPRANSVIAVSWAAFSTLRRRHRAYLAANHRLEEPLQLRDAFTNAPTLVDLRQCETPVALRRYTGVPLRLQLQDIGGRLDETRFTLHIPRI